MKKPLITLCIFLFFGIITAHFFSISIDITYVLYSTIISLAILLLYERGFVIFILITVFIFGAYLYGRSIVGDIVLESASNDIEISARILSQGSSKNRFNEYEVEVLSLFDNNTGRSIKVNKNAQLKIYESFIDQSIFTINNIIDINNVKVTKVLGSTNTDQLYNYDFFLKSKGIEYILEVDLESIMQNNRYNQGSIGIRLMSYKVKIYLEDFLDSTLDFENSNILKSIMFGNQAYLSRDKLDLFSKTGTAHIMAVSGLHVGIIVLIAEKFLAFIKVGRNNILRFTVVILIFYTYIVNFPISIVRAGVMYILFVASYFLHRRYDSINALFLIAFALLIYRPMTIFSISFQLSFIATISILLLSPIINRVLNNKIGFLSSLLSVTLAAQIGTLPIMIYHFNQISTISIFTNILIVPLLAPILFIAFISILAGFISFELGFLINQITNHLLNYINWITTKCAIIPYGSLEVRDLKIIYILGYYILLSITYFLYNRQRHEQIQKCNKEEGLVKTHEL